MRSNTLLRAIFLIALVALALGPLWADKNTMRILGEGFVLCALAMLWNLLAGFAGRVSVGQQAYVGIGAYLMLAFTQWSALNPLAVIPLAAIIGAAIAIPLAYVVFRLRGHYFAIGTWAIAEIIRLIVMQIPALGGGSGASLPSAAMKLVNDDRTQRLAFIYLAGFALLVVVMLGTLVFMRSRYGLALRAMRDSELAAESLGIKLQPLRVALYCVVSGLTVAIGGLILLQKLRISPDAAFSVQEWTAFVIFITVIGGVATLEGPIIGTVIFIIMREALADLGPLYLIALGLVAIGMMLFAPKGVWGIAASRFGASILPDRHHPPVTKG